MANSCLLARQWSYIAASRGASLTPRLQLLEKSRLSDETVESERFTCIHGVSRDSLITFAEGAVARLNVAFVIAAHFLQGHRRLTAHLRGVRRMMKLIEGNVLLKPSHRRQLMTWLKRALRLGERLGDFAMTLTLHRVGKRYEVTARVHDARGDFDCRARQADWRGAFRDLCRAVMSRLHQQSLGLAVA